MAALVERRPEPRDAESLEAAAALLYAAERAGDPALAALCRECAAAIAWFAAHRDQLRQAAPPRVVIFREPRP